MTRPKNVDLRSFLDLEVEVDNDIEEESDEDIERDAREAFINDNDSDSDGDSPSPDLNIRNAYQERGDEALDEHLEDLLQRSKEASRRAGREVERIDEESRHGAALENLVAFIPQPGDYPLWRVDCRLGVEEEAVFSLLQTARECHQLRSAFTRGSIRGVVYLECTMNYELRRLLKKTPGIIVYGRQGIMCRQVDNKDHQAVLEMKQTGKRYHIGDWVLITRGLYKGDPALVTDVFSWGVQVLLVPRISPNKSNPKKRKSTAAIPKAQVFEPDVYRELFPNNVIHNTDGTYRMGLLNFTHGLLSKSFDVHSFSTDIRDIPIDHHHMFVSSMHPHVKVSHMPRPREWSFKAGEKIYKLSDGMPGVVVQPNVYDVEILSTVEGGASCVVPWYNIRKLVAVGDFVSVTAGVEMGRSGWILDLEDDQCTIGCHRFRTSDGDVVEESREIESFDTLINYATITLPPFEQAKSWNPQLQAHVHHAHEQPEDPAEPFATHTKRRPHPWCGIHIVICKGARKSRPGVVLDVISIDPCFADMVAADGNLKETPADQIFVDIRVESYNPATPFQRIRLPYPDIKESRSLKELVVFKNPGLKFIRPPLPKPPASKTRQSQVTRSLPVQSVATTSSSTPMWDPSSGPSSSTPAWDPCSSTPAWDPSSCTPVQDPWARHSPGPSSCGPVWEALARPSPGPSSSPTHFLLNDKLEGCEFRGVVSRGDFSEREMPVMVFRVGGNLVIRGKHTKTEWVVLDPEWVTAKQPSARLDNSLLIVIKGIHTGKYVRRIWHMEDNRGPHALVVAVVSRVPNAANALSGEELTIDLDSLGIAPETKAEKAGKKSLIEPLRSRWRTG